MQVAVSALSSNFGLIGFTVLEIEQFYILAFWLEIAYSRPLLGGLGHISPNDVIYRCNPQKTLPCAETRRLSHKEWKSVQRFDLGTGSRKKGQDRTGQWKKSQRRYISPIRGEAPTEPIFTKNCTIVAVPDVIMCANFGAEIFRGYDFTGGRISRFPIDSFMGLTTVQRYCAACDINTCLPKSEDFTWPWPCRLEGQFVVTRLILHGPNRAENLKTVALAVPKIFHGV